MECLPVTPNCCCCCCCCWPRPPKKPGIGGLPAAAFAAAKPLPSQLLPRMILISPPNMPANGGRLGPAPTPAFHPCCCCCPNTPPGRLVASAAAAPTSPPNMSNPAPSPAAALNGALAAAAAAGSPFAPAGARSEVAECAAGRPGRSAKETRMVRPLGMFVPSIMRAARVAASSDS